jgi:EAL domain-containing protein (putative c-di-GMP-specific phosphodiesterase class I)
MTATFEKYGLSTMRCPDCEHVDPLVFDTTRLWFHVPTQDSFDKLTNLCGRKGMQVEKLDDRCISMTLSASECNVFVVALYGNMTQHELKNVRVLTTDGKDLSALDIGRVVNGDVFVNRIKGSWIIEKVCDGQVEIWYQPIYDFQNLDTPFGMEALLRMRDQNGAIIPPDYVFRVAGDADVLFSIDLIARATAVETAAKAGYLGKIFVNFNPSSVYDPAYCLRTTAAAINDLGLKPSDIVFEITETERITDIDHLKGILNFYRRAGFMCALDDIGSGGSGLNLLHTFNPDFVKLDMELIRDIDTDMFKQSIVRNLINIAKDQGIKVIAEGIETQGEAEFVKKAGADLTQGYLYSRPAPVATYQDRAPDWFRAA